jgi:hypothetical protein
MTVSESLTHYYRQNRAHQMKIANEGGGTLTVYQSGRTESSYASAPYGGHAISAYMQAKRDLRFAERRRKIKRAEAR